MTAVNSYLSPGAVVVMTDTLCTGDTGPAMFVAKVWPLPHISTLISGRGSLELIAWWAMRASTAYLVADFDMLVGFTTDALAERWAEMEGNRPESTTVFCWGWSGDQGRFAGYAFRSGTGFAPEPLEDGTRYAPGLADEVRAAEIREGSLNPIVAMRDMMIAAADEGRAAPDAADRCWIGGEIVAWTMTVPEDDGPISTHSQIVHLFPDRDRHYAQALEVINTAR